MPRHLQRGNLKTLTLFWEAEFNLPIKKKNAQKHFECFLKLFTKYLREIISIFFFLESKLFIENAPFVSPMYTIFQGKLLNSLLDLYHSLEEQP